MTPSDETRVTGAGIVAAWFREAVPGWTFDECDAEYFALAARIDAALAQREAEATAQERARCAGIARQAVERLRAESRLWRTGLIAEEILAAILAPPETTEGGHG